MMGYIGVCIEIMETQNENYFNGLCGDLYRDNGNMETTRMGFNGVCLG